MCADLWISGSVKDFMSCKSRQACQSYYIYIEQAQMNVILLYHFFSLFGVVVVVVDKIAKLSSDRILFL